MYAFEFFSIIHTEKTICIIHLEVLIKKYFTLILLSLFLFLAACGDDRSEIDVITFQDTGNDILDVQLYIAQTIIEEGYETETDVMTASTMSAFQGLQEGDIHVGLEIWTENQKEVWEEGLESGDIIDL